MPIRFNILHAKAYIKDKVVAEDLIVLHGLPQAPAFNRLYTDDEKVKDTRGYTYIYRVNCGGPKYVDQQGHVWEADRPLTSDSTWGSSSWTNDFDNLPAVFASQRRTFDPIKGTRNWSLMQTFRYGKDKLDFQFPVPDGDYLVELYFIEPWFGTGGGMDCKEWRLFDIAINGAIVDSHVDIWNEVGHDQVLKRKYTAKAKNGRIVINFPRVAAGQALISAIAIAAKEKIKAAAPSPLIIQQARFDGDSVDLQPSTWLDLGDGIFAEKPDYFTEIPPVLFGATWLRFPAHVKEEQKSLSFKVSKDADVYILLPKNGMSVYDSLAGYADTQAEIASQGVRRSIWKVYRKRFEKNSLVNLIFGKNKLPLAPVIVVPVSKLQSAHDLKTSITYKPSTAMRSSGTTAIRYLEKEALKLPAKGPAQIDWTIKTGVADTYSITLRYANDLKQPIAGKLALRTLDGSLLHEEDILFTPSRAGKWSYSYNNTATMINAGQYVVTLTLPQSNGLVISNLDVQ